jgi:hypothetical protein
MENKISFRVQSAPQNIILHRKYEGFVFSLWTLKIVFYCISGDLNLVERVETPPRFPLYMVTYYMHYIHGQCEM